MADARLILSSDQPQGLLQTVGQGMQFGDALKKMLVGNKLAKINMLSTPEQQDAAANAAFFAPDVTAALKAQRQAAFQTQIDQAKDLAKINMDNASAGKSTAEAGEIGQKTGASRINATLPVYQIMAQGGGVDGGLMVLDNLHKSGAIDDNTYQSVSGQLGGLRGQDSEALKQFGFTTYKASLDPKYNYQTADNAADNENRVTTTDMNNKTSLEVAQKNADSAADVAHINGGYVVQRTRLEQEGQNFRQGQTIDLDTKKFNYQRQQDILNRKNYKEIATGVDGNQYIVHVDGSLALLRDSNGAPIKAAPKGGTQTTSQADEKQRIQRIDAILPEIEKILPNATHSWLGKGLDALGTTVGVSTSGAQASAQLKTLSGQLVSLMPKMSGPQSDKDVAMYKEMAGNLADDTLPINTRLAALKTIQNLNNKYRTMSGGNQHPTQHQGSTNGQTFSMKDIKRAAVARKMSVPDVIAMVRANGGTVAQ